MADQNEPDMVGFQSEADFDRVAAATKYVEGLIRTGTPAWVNPSNGGPVICDVRITGARDGTTHLFPGQQVIPKPKALPAAKTYLDVGKVWVYDLNDADLTNGQKYRGVGAFTYTDGVPVILVTVGGSGGTASDWFPARIVSGTDAGGYAIAEQEMTPAGTWADKSGGRTGTGWRMPSNTTTPDYIAGQVVQARPSPATAGAYELDPFGSVDSYNTGANIVTNVSGSISATCNADGTLTIDLTLTQTKQTLTINGRDVTGSLT